MEYAAFGHAHPPEVRAALARAEAKAGRALLEEMRQARKRGRRSRLWNANEVRWAAAALEVEAAQARR